MSVARDHACILRSCQWDRAGDDLSSMRLSKLHFKAQFLGNDKKLIWNHSAAISRFPAALFYFRWPGPTLEERPKLLFNVYSHTAQLHASMCDHTQKYVKIKFQWCGGRRVTQNLKTTVARQTQRSFGRWLRKLNVVSFIDRTLIEMRLFVHNRSVLCLLLLECFAKRCVSIVTTAICLTLTASAHNRK